MEITFANTVYKTQLINAESKGLCIFIKSAKFLIWLKKRDKLKTKYKNLALC